MSESSRLTQEESDYLDYVGSEGKVTPETCQAFLNYWKDSRADIADNSDLDDEEKAHLNEVLDEFASFY